MQPDTMEARVRQCLADAFDADTARESRLENLGGHASLRIYWRVHLVHTLLASGHAPRQEPTLMAMVLPEGQGALKSEEGTSVQDPDVQELPFIDVQRFLGAIGARVPAIDCVDMPRGVLLLEDLGQEMFEHAVLAASDAAHVEELYRQAIELLVDFQTRVRDTAGEAGSPAPSCIAWGRAFDASLLRWELDHYREWGVEALLGPEATRPWAETLEQGFAHIVAALGEVPQTMVLRDFQSRNIMRKNGQWVLIDFQDALMGPVVYDLVALLRDSYIALGPEQVDALLEYYIATGQRAGLDWCHDAPAVRRAFHLQTVQRKLKDAGRFIFIDRVKHNPGFLPYFEPSLGYVRHALSRLPELEMLRAPLGAFHPDIFG